MRLNTDIQIIHLLKQIQVYEYSNTHSILQYEYAPPLAAFKGSFK